MNRRKVKRSLANIITSTPLEDEEESIENISRALNTPLENNTSVIISQNKLSGDVFSKPKKPKINSKTAQIKPYATKYFEEITDSAGLKLFQESGKHHLTCEPMIFQRNIKNTLENNVDYPRNVSEFVKGFKNVSNEQDELKQFLIQNVMLIAGDEEEQRVIPDSVLKLFLNVLCIQVPLTAYVVERATEFAIDDKPTWIQLLLRPFSFLENINPESKLMNGIIELMDVSGHSARQEVITCLPNIIASMPHENVVLELVKYLNEDPTLIPTILDCLSFLSLSNALKDQVRTQMLNVLKTSPSPSFFPNLVTFFFIGNNSDNNLDVIRGFRDNLDWTMHGTQSNVDISSSQVMTIMALKNVLTKCKNLSTSWLKVINQVKSSDEHKPLDIVVLLILYSISSVKEMSVEGMFRKRIKQSLFSRDLLDVTFKKFKPVMKEYLNEMVKICRALLKTKNEPLVSDFSSHWFIVLFKELRTSQKTVIRELLMRDYSESDDTIMVSLNILTKIAQESIEMLKPHSLLIFALKDMLDSLSMDGIHHVMDLLAGLAYGVENSFLDGDIHMMINKQLGSCDTNVKVRGIILGVMSVKHLVVNKTAPDEDMNTEASFSELSSLPEGPAKEAATIIELIVRSTSKKPNLTCLFYDELSHVLSAAQSVNNKFILWLSSYVTDDLTDVFIVDVNENTPKSIHGIPVSVEYCLNTPDEADGQIALNIAGLCLEESKDGGDLRILPSLLRLTQSIYMMQYDGDLSSIDALLGCGILMPAIRNEDLLDEYDSDNVNGILDCLVYCINWFRELINAFSLQNHTYLRRRVIERFNALICLEKKLELYLRNYPLIYKIPICSYETSNTKSKPTIIEKVKKAAKKKGPAKSKPVVEDHDASVAIPATLKTQADTSHIVPENSSNKIVKLNSNIFRLLDIQVLTLLDEELVVECQIEDALQNPNNTFNLDILSLLLQEINSKIAETFPSKIKKKTFLSKPSDTNHYHTNPEETLRYCIGIMPRVCCCMEIIAVGIQSLLNEREGGRDSLGLLTVKCNKEQECLSSLFSMLSTILSWIGFQSPSNLPKLKEGLKVFATRRDVNNTKINSLRDLVTECCIYILRYKDWCLLITVAVSLVGLFKTLTRIYEDKDVTKHFVLLSLDMLSVAWKDPCGITEKGLIFNQHLDYLLSCYFIHPDITMISSLTSELKTQCPLLNEKNSILNTFRCISKSNFPLLYRSAYGALYDAAKREIDNGLTDKQHVELWKNIARIMNDFMEILKLQESRTNLLTFLKKSIPLFRLFLSQGMPMMELKLKSNPDSVVEVLKTLQNTTRFLHSLHCHSRLKKDTAFVAYLPQMKLILETLVYKVKIALTSNNCSEAFWMGNLRNKNLQGEVIPSQSTVQDEEELDDQLPEDNHSGESDLEEDMTDPGSKTVSKMF